MPTKGLRQDGDLFAGRSLFRRNSRPFETQRLRCAKLAPRLREAKSSEEDMTWLVHNLQTVIVPLAVLLMLGVFADVSAVEATHFRGGTISWKPSSNYSASNREVHFSFRLSWSYEHAGCTNASITSGALIGDSDLRWSCSYGCNGPVGTIRTHCTDFSFRDNWSSGQNTFDYVFLNDGLFEISFMYCCWINTLATGDNSEWAMTTKLLLGTRSDTGKINTAPIVTSPLTFRLDIGVSAVIALNVSDHDNDNVTCRLGRNFGECGSVCTLYNDFTLDENNCRIIYRPTQNISGNVPLSIVVEDHHNKDHIRVGDRIVIAKEALSAVPYQFIIQVGDSLPPPRDCVDVLPQLHFSIDSAPVAVTKIGRMFEFDVQASTCDSNSRIVDFHLVGPEGARMSNTTVKRDGSNCTKLQWQPRSGQEGRHQICISARESTGLTSEERCVTVIVEQALSFCRGNDGMRFMTFDKFQYAFAGACKYQLVLTTFDPLQVVGQNLQPFNITVSNDLDAVSGNLRINTIQIIIGMRSIELQRDRKVVIDGVRSHVPIRFPGVFIYISGKYVTLSTDSGMTVRYDGRSVFAIGLPSQYANNVQGLCGDFNGISDDDLPRRKKIAASLSSVELGNTFLIGGQTCSQPPPRDVPLCEDSGRATSVSACSIISSTTGCFASCHVVIPPQMFFDTCVDTVCTATSFETTVNGQVEAYANACQLEGAIVCDWRSRVGAALECPPNSHYNACGSSEPLSCANVDFPPQTSAVCVEGCVCNEGYVLSGDICVPPEQCGCFLQGSYRRKGFQYRAQDCQFQCVCLGQNKTQCLPASRCSTEEICGPHADGFMRCAPRKPAPATCKAIGDPHYKTFDGATYDSMSTCAHILVRSRADATVTPFTVVTINHQPRPNNTVSHVGEVQVSVGADMHTNVTLSQGPVIKYNGEVVLPGTSVPGVNFSRSTHFLTATFDFGLVIRWDGVDRLRVSAWSNLRNQVEGLCGNYDGDSSNDFASANGGGLVADVDKFVNSWRVTGLDIAGNSFPEPPRNASEVCLRHGFRGNLLQQCLTTSSASSSSDVATCRDRVVGNLTSPCDNPSNRNQYRTDCYILLDPTGPFASCHSVFNPISAYESCLFDLCAYQGNQTFRERVLASYDYDCRERSIVPGDWRNSSDLPLLCGVNSQHSTCMSQCQPSCDDLDGSKCEANMNLGNQCEEGCQCVEGFVRNVTGDCVAKESCGCVINGRYQLQGFTYRTNNCTKQCQCTAENTVQCSSVPKCKIGLKCENDTAGYQRCTGRLRRRVSCKAVGDPHHKTFDGTFYDSMGTCAYIMVRRKASSSGTNFTVVAVNENPSPGDSVSSVKEVWVHFGASHTMIFRKGPVVTLDGVEIAPGTEMMGFTIRKNGKFVLVEFDFRILIRWDGIDRLRIIAWEALRGQIEGLCGNFDDDETNDYQASTGEVTELFPFIKSWEIPGYGTEGCFLPPTATVEDLCADGDSLARFSQECSVLTNATGPYAKCHDTLPPWTRYANCIYDMCAFNGSQEIKIGIFEEYLDDCVNSGVPPNDFVGIQLRECADNQHFDAAGSECQPTCTDPDASRCASNSIMANSTFDGCVCNDGFILSGDQCVLASECGCVTDGRYHKKGFMYRTSKCDQECICAGNNNVTCYDASPCPRRSKCKTDVDGFKRCVKRLRRRATCKAVTDPHYMTFDGTTYDSMGMCSYIMVRNKPNATHLDFRVVAVNEQPIPRRIVSHVKEVFVHFGNRTMRFMGGPVIQLDGVTVNPGFRRDGIEIRKAGVFTLVDWDFGLTIRWDGDDRLRVSAWSPLRYQVEGLCGSFDENKDNDLLAPDGKQFSLQNIDDFVNSWIIEGYGAEGCGEDIKSDVLPRPCADPSVLAAHRNTCQVIIDPNGPMRNCQNLVDADATFQACVYDQCAYEGDPRQKDRIISSYIATCLDEDEEENEGNQTVAVPDWRKLENSSTPECPPHSSFVNCLLPCQPSCDDPDSSICLSNPRLGNACVEGCQADDGFVQSGDQFVTLRHCGCMLDGEYYLDGQTFLTNNCSSKCTCSEASVTCVPAGCPENRECRANRKGDLTCLPLRKETCKVWGNGHFTTFDNHAYNLQTPCSYVLAAPANPSDTGGVTLEMERSSDGIRTQIRSVTVRFQGFNGTITLHKTENGVQAMINGRNVVRVQKIEGPAGHELVVQYRGRFAVLVTTKGHRVEFDGDQLLLKLPVTYFALIRGLCGNFNGDPTDDMTTITSDLTNDVERFAASYRTEQCNASPVATNASCSEEESQRWSSSEMCGVITNTSGPLSPCNRVLRVSASRRYRQNCIKDMCNAGGSTRTLESAVVSYAHECLTRGIRMCNWRQAMGFSMSCPENTHYEGCAAACPPTCGEIRDPDDDDCTFAENCVCNDGYVLKDGVCVPVQSCGCRANGVTWSYGQTFTTDNCTQSCTCYGEGKIECRDFPGCRQNNMCVQVRGGSFACVRTPRTRVSCKVVAGRRYKTFDETSFHSNTSCAYTMVKSLENSRGISNFSVVVVNERLNTSMPQSRITEIKVSYADGSHELIMKPGVVVMIDGVIVTAGTSLSCVQITNVGDFVVAAFDFGLVIRWNGGRHLRIDAWRKLRGKVQGLCGDFDDLPFNDFVMSNGSVTDDVASFVNSWKLTDRNDSSCQNRLPGRESPPCGSRSELTRARNHCNILLDRDGPFEACHQYIDPHGSFNDCVFDSCVAGTDASDGNRVIDYYSKSCAEEGGPVTWWRHEARRVPDCPLHSFYNECISQCQPSYADRNASFCRSIDELGQNCVEGCQCVDGYLLKNGKCVRVEEHKCVTSNNMAILANSSGYDAGCTQLCECSMGVLSCKPSSCYVDQYCGMRKNTYGCHWIDECEYNNGGCSHACTRVGNVSRCSCPPKYLMSEDGKTCIRPAAAEEKVICDDGQSEKDRYAVWRQKTFKEWMAKLERYMSTVSEATDQSGGAAVCESQWTEWLDRDDPGGEGDEETLSKLRHEFPQIICANPVAMEARMKDGRPITVSSNIVKMNVQEGLLCLNRDQPDGKRCGDFQVRFLCLGSLV